MMKPHDRATLSARHSLRWRLPLLVSALITLVLITFLWAAYRTVEATLVRAGGERAQGAADQVANLLDAQRAGEELRRVAGDADLRRYLQSRTAEARARALKRLASLAPSGPRRVELWDDAGSRVLEVSVPGTAASGATPRVLPPGTRPSSVGISTLQVSDDIVFSDAVAQIREENSLTEQTATSGRLGYLVVRSTFTVNPPGIIGRLVGRDAVVAVANRTGGTWTDLSRVVPAPGVDLTRNGVAEYRGANGELHLGAVSHIGGTPWAAWVEFPRAVMVAPARGFLNEMIVVALIFVAGGAILARTLTGGITGPLSELSRAAEAIAAGDFSRRVASDRRDEIGRLGAAFNVMAAHVAESHDALEARVHARTQDLEQARQELDWFFSLSLDLLCIAGTDGHFRRVNPAWEQVLGWTAADLTSVPYIDLVHPDDRAATAVEAAKLSDGLTTLSFENRYRCKDGSYRWLSWKAAPLRDRGLIYAAAHDVTEQKRAARDLQQQAAQLAEANRELEAFSYSVSHDLRAPLRHVTGFAALLEKAAGERLDEQGRRYVKTIHDSAAHMGRLIDDLLALSRLGRAELRQTMVDLNHVVAEAKQEVEREAAAACVDWALGTLPVVPGDPSLLRVAFVNLLSNAVKYSRTRATPRIEVRADGLTPNEAVVYVRDNGVGFDMQYAHKLFGVFQRLHSREEFDGTGIGLATVRRILQRHGGRVWAEGAVDVGATFFIAMPRGGPIDDRQT